MNPNLHDIAKGTPEQSGKKKKWVGGPVTGPG
jgi:hypothetical protein